MYFNKFSVRVVGGDEVSNGYVEMEHGQVYRLCLRNNRHVQCDAKVVIDGKEAGTWRIPSRSAITLERPVNDTGQFTFYELGTPEARKAHLSVFSDDLGRVSVTFSPEKVRPVVRELPSTPQWPPKPPQWNYTAGGPPDFSSLTAEFGSPGAAGEPEYGGEALLACAGGGTQSRAMSKGRAGGTGLSGRSNQQFGTIGPIDYDMEQQTTINLRLVAIKDEPRPLTAHANPVPPRI